jgi:hypothetical protein
MLGTTIIATEVHLCTINRKAKIASYTHQCNIFFHREVLCNVQHISDPEDNKQKGVNQREEFPEKWS